MILCLDIANGKTDILGDRQNDYIVKSGQNKLALLGERHSQRQIMAADHQLFVDAEIVFADNFRMIIIIGMECFESVLHVDVIRDQDGVRFHIFDRDRFREGS